MDESHKSKFIDWETLFGSKHEMGPSEDRIEISHPKPSPHHVLDHSSGDNGEVIDLSPEPDVIEYSLEEYTRYSELALQNDEAIRTLYHTIAEALGGDPLKELTLERIMRQYHNSAQLWVKIGRLCEQEPKFKQFFQDLSADAKAALDEARRNIEPPRGLDDL